MERALELIRSSRMSITDIAFERLRTSRQLNARVQVSIRPSPLAFRNAELKAGANSGR